MNFFAYEDTMKLFWYFFNLLILLEDDMRTNIKHYIFICSNVSAKWKIAVGFSVFLLLAKAFLILLQTILAISLDFHFQTFLLPSALVVHFCNPLSDPHRFFWSVSTSQPYLEKARVRLRSFMISVEMISDDAAASSSRCFQAKMRENSSVFLF